MSAVNIVQKPIELDHADVVQKNGFSILHDIVSPGLVHSIQEELEPAFAEAAFCEGNFYGPSTKRFGSLLKRSQAVDDLIRHPVILDIVQAALGPWCDTIQLNLGQAIEIYPGSLQQFPHRDQDMWRGANGEIEYLVNVMWPLTSFTAQNGATVIYPGSHGKAALDDAFNAVPITAECEPGSAIVFLGSTLHGGGANRSPLPRRGILISYCLGWLKPYENQWLVYPPEIAKTFPRELAELIGYRQHRPNLGNYEGQCPSILLEGSLPTIIHPIDALRPDQEVMLSDFVEQQRRENVRTPQG